MIGFLTNEYPGLTKYYGGIGTSIRDLCVSLKCRGVTPVVFLLNNDFDKIDEYDGIKIYYIKKVSLPFLTNLLTGFKVSVIINKCVKNHVVNLIEVPDWTGLSAFVNVDCAIVMRLNGSETYFAALEGRRPRFKYQYFERIAYKKANYIISSSAFTGLMTEKVLKVKKDFIVIPNGVDENLFKPLNDGYVKKSVLYFGTLARKKGVFDLPDIFVRIKNRIPDVNFKIIGRDNPDGYTSENSTWELLNRFFESNGIFDVQYFGPLKREDLIQHIQSASVCVFPSFAEAFPVSWLEAMSCGKPVVAYDIGWAKEMIAHGVDGILVGPKDLDEFASKVCEILLDEKCASVIGNAARLTVMNRFRSSLLAETNYDFYKSIS